MSYAYAYDATDCTIKGLSTKMGRYASSYGMRECVAMLPLFVSGASSKSIFLLFVEGLIRGGHREIMIFYPSKFGCSLDMEKGEDLRSLGVELKSYDSGEIIGVFGGKKNKVDTSSSPSKSSSSHTPEKKAKTTDGEKSTRKRHRKKAPKKEKLDEPVVKEKSEKAVKESHYTDEEYEALLFSMQSAEHISPDWPSFLVRRFMKTKRGESLPLCYKSRKMPFEEFVSLLDGCDVFSPGLCDEDKAKIAGKIRKTIFDRRVKKEKTITDTEAQEPVVANKTDEEDSDDCIS